MSDYQLGVIGGGNMGEALVRGIIDNSPRVLPKDVIVVTEQDVATQRSNPSPILKPALDEGRELYASA